jgi:5-carboxymethyl-2-hydroxymuconic-semialdehyde dehydrogenase
MPRVGNNFRFSPTSSTSWSTLIVRSAATRERITYDPPGWSPSSPVECAIDAGDLADRAGVGCGEQAGGGSRRSGRSSLLADITKQAGLPDGVFNVVQGTGADAGAPLTAHPGIRRLSFTGSVPTARVIARAAAPNIVPVSFELGGKSPLIVFADSDFDLAVSIAVEQFDNSGQVCLGAFRILVENSIADRFTQAVLEKATTIVQGDPRDEATDMSCLITRQHFLQGRRLRAASNAAGARPILGGSPNDELGHPTTGRRSW